MADPGAVAFHPCRHSGGRPLSIAHPPGPMGTVWRRAPKSRQCCVRILRPFRLQHCGEYRARVDALPASSGDSNLAALPIMYSLCHVDVVGTPRSIYLAARRYHRRADSTNHPHVIIYAANHRRRSYTDPRTHMVVERRVVALHALTPPQKTSDLGSRSVRGRISLLLAEYSRSAGARN